MGKKVFGLGLFLAFCLNVAFAFAYIDPGTAGTIIGGGIWGFLVVAGSAIALFFSKRIIRPIKRLFGNRRVSQFKKERMMWD